MLLGILYTGELYYLPVQHLYIEFPALKELDSFRFDNHGVFDMYVGKGNLVLVYSDMVDQLQLLYIKNTINLNLV